MNFFYSFRCLSIPTVGTKQVNRMEMAGDIMCFLHSYTGKQHLNPETQDFLFPSHANVFIVCFRTKELIDYHLAIFCSFLQNGSSSRSFTTKPELIRNSNSKNAWLLLMRAIFKSSNFKLFTLLHLMIIVAQKGTIEVSNAYKEGTQSVLFVSQYNYTFLSYMFNLSVGF